MRRYSQLAFVLAITVAITSCAALAQNAAQPATTPGNQQAAPEASQPSEAPVTEPAQIPCPPATVAPGAALNVTPCPPPNMSIGKPGGVECEVPFVEPGYAPILPGEKVGLPRPEMTEPISLERALELAFQYNPGMRIAADQAQRARYVVAEARANFNPRFSAALVHLRQNKTTASFPSAPGQPTQSFVIQAPSDTNGRVTGLLPLDINHALGYTEDIAKLQFRAQYLNLVTSAEQLILDVKSAYYDLLRACGQRQASLAAVEVAQVRLANTRARFEAGTVPRFDVTTAEVDVANLNQQLIQSENRVLVAQAALNRVMGIAADVPTQVVNVPVPVDVANVDIAQCTQVALARRPELNSARTAVQLNENNVKLQRTAYLPSLSLTGETGYLFQTTGLNTTNTSWQLALNLNIPIWNGGITKARVNQAQEDVNTAADTLEQSKLGVSLQVRTAALALEEAATRVQTTAASVALAEEALRLANVRYEAGIATLVEVTNAESQLTQARFNNVNAVYDYAVALAQLRRATSTQPELEQVQLLDELPSL